MSASVRSATLELDPHAAQSPYDDQAGRDQVDERVQVLNARLDPLTLEALVDDLVSAARKGRRGWVATVNVAILMQMRKNPLLQRFVDRAGWAVADGQPLVWHSRSAQRALPERVVGVELIEPICARAEEEGLGVYLLGGTPEVIEAVARRLRTAYPRLRLSWSDGYFPMEEATRRAGEIANSGADILFVGLGVPRQEVFIAEQWTHLGAAVAIGVGGSFNVLAGTLNRAPEWVQKRGLEWAYRLKQEPGRLWKRYLVTNSHFVAVVARDKLRRTFLR